MKIRSIIFKSPEPKIKVPKMVTVYISEKHAEIIIAPYFKDSRGIHYEQSKCEVIGLNSSPEKIGQIVKQNFDKFDIQERKQVKGNKSDWPAYQMSKEKSMRGFEENYLRISISGVNESNIILRIETVMNSPSEIELTSTISAHCEPIELGKRILKIFRSEISIRD